MTSLILIKKVFMYQSLIKPSVAVPFPAFLGQRIYMEKFHKEEGLPTHMRHWQPTVDAMLTEVDTDNPIYLMVDQGIVQAGVSHRRPGKHIDGYWHHSIRAHGSTGGGHCSTPEDQKSNSSGHGPRPHMAGRYGNDDWSKATLEHPEAIILASDIVGCKAFLGEWHYPMGHGGNCADMDTSGMQELILEAGRAYIGSVGMVHESIPQTRNIKRTLVRLNVADWEPKFQ